MRRLLATTAAALALVTSCGVASDDTAATVEGTDVSNSEVAALARTSFVSDIATQQGVGLVEQAPGATGSAKLRIALGIIVQTIVLENEVESRGGEVTSEDRASADEQVAQTEQQTAASGGSGQLEPRVKALLLRYTAAQAALVRLEGGLDVDAPTDAEIDAYFADHRDDYGVQTCLDGFAVQQPNAAAAQELIDGGAEVSDVLAATELQAQPITDTGAETCVPAGQVGDEQLRAAVDEGPLGVWSTVSIEDDPTVGPIIVFVRPNSREELTAETPSVRDEIATQLQTDARNEKQAALQETLGTIVDDADVQIDSRYGSWDPSLTQVVAPSVPRLSAEATAGLNLGGE